jgi:hypothetical protein
LGGGATGSSRCRGGGPETHPCAATQGRFPAPTGKPGETTGKKYCGVFASKTIFLQRTGTKAPGTQRLAPAKMPQGAFKKNNAKQSKKRLKPHSNKFKSTANVKKGNPTSAATRFHRFRSANKVRPSLFSSTSMLCSPPCHRLLDTENDFRDQPKYRRGVCWPCGSERSSDPMW